MPVRVSHPCLRPLLLLTLVLLLNVDRRREHQSITRKGQRQQRRPRGARCAAVHHPEGPAAAEEVSSIVELRCESVVVVVAVPPWLTPSSHNHRLTRPSPDRHGREDGAGPATGGGHAEEEGRTGDVVAAVTWLPWQGNLTAA